MMHDYTFDEIIELVHQRIPLIPKETLNKIIRKILRSIFSKLNNKKSSVAMRGASVSRFYHRIDFEALERSMMDVDETSEKTPKLISKIHLRRFNETRSPRHKLRGNKKTTLVYHRGAYAK